MVLPNITKQNRFNYEMNDKYYLLFMLFLMIDGVNKQKLDKSVHLHLPAKKLQNDIALNSKDDFGDHAAIMDFLTKWGKLDFEPAQKTVINTGKYLLSQQNIEYLCFYYIKRSFKNVRNLKKMLMSNSLEIFFQNAKQLFIVIFISKFN